MIYELFRKLLQNTSCDITIYDSSDYYKSRQRALQFTISTLSSQITTTINTIYDRYYNSQRLLLQFTAGITIHDVITIHDSTYLSTSFQTPRTYTQYNRQHSNTVPRASTSTEQQQEKRRLWDCNGRNWFKIRNSYSYVNSISYSYTDLKHSIVCVGDHIKIGTVLGN